MIGWLQTFGLLYLAAAVLGYTSTLTHTTRLLYALLGAILGFTLVPLASLAGNPLREPSLWPMAVSTALTIAVLCLPAFSVLGGRQRMRYGVADGFFLAFMVGLGYDAAASAVHLMDGNPIKWSTLPPGIRWQGHLWGGYAYWCGLIGLATVAGRRFAAVESWGGVWAVFALLLGTADRLATDPGWFPLFAKATMMGQLVPILALAALFILGEYENAWLKSSPAYRGLLASPELAVPRGPLPERWRAMRTRRQVLLERVEMLRAGYTSLSSSVREAPLAVPMDVTRLAIGGLAWLALLTSPLWLSGSSTGLVMLLAAAIMWFFLRQPELDPEDGEGIARVRGEELVVNVSLLMLLLMWLTGLGLAELPYVRGGQYPELPGLAALVALAACTLTGSRRGEWLAFLSPEQRNVAIVHRALVGFKTLALAVACAMLYGSWYRIVQVPLVGIVPEWFMHVAAVLTMALLAILAARILNRAGDVVEKAVS